MATTQKDVDMSDAQSTKRKNVDEAGETSEPPSKAAKTHEELVPIPKSPRKEKEEKKKESHELLNWPIERLMTDVNPLLLKSLRETGQGGYVIPDAQLVTTARPYGLNVDAIREKFKSLISAVLTLKLNERGDRSATAIDTLAERVSIITADVCMAALYAKLRTLNRHIGKYKQRYTTQNTYSKDVELPLPFAIAIENWGSFVTSAMSTRYLVYPVHPENTKYEGRSKEDLDVSEYEAAIQLFNEIGLPLKNIDPRLKTGTAWWTYAVLAVDDSYDLSCIYPPLHYTDHSAVIASMFLGLDASEPTKCKQIISHYTEESYYGVRLRDVRDGVQYRSFAALCQWDDQEWNLASNV